MQEIKKSSSFTKSASSGESPRKFGDFRDKYVGIPFVLDIGYHVSYRYLVDYHYLRARDRDDRKTLNEMVLINTSNCLNIALESVVHLQRKYGIPTKALNMAAYALQVVNITDDVFKSIMNDGLSVLEVLGEGEFGRIREKYFRSREYEGFFPDAVSHACEFLSYLGKTNNSSYLAERAKKDYFLVGIITQYPRLRKLFYHHTVEYSLYDSLMEASQADYYHSNHLVEDEVLRDSRTLRIEHDYSTGDCADGNFKYHHDSYLVPLDCRVDELVDVELFNFRSRRDHLDRSVVRDDENNTNGYITIR